MRPHHHPLVKRGRRRLEILRRTGRWRPDHVQLAASGHAIHVDPSDPRGWEIVRGLGRGHQPALMSLWTRAVAAVDPDLVIDVGANYGEMVLSARYPATARVLALEPNPAVARRLRRSVAQHPDAASMAVVEALASDGSGRGVLWVDRGWSGSASASRPDGSTHAVDVDVTTLDALAGESPRTPRVVLKVDAEGWEDHVLRGGAALLAAASLAVVIVEFEPEHLARAGADPDAVFERLRGVGPCWTVAYDGTVGRADAPPAHGGDLVAISDAATAAALGAR